jgi:hypothetical protein
MLFGFVETKRGLITKLLLINQPLFW